MNKDTTKEELPKLMDHIAKYGLEHEFVSWVIIVREDDGVIAIRPYFMNDDYPYDDPYVALGFDCWCYYEIGTIDEQNARFTFTAPNIPALILTKLANKEFDVA